MGDVDPGGVANLYGLWDYVGMAPCMGPIRDFLRLVRSRSRPFRMRCHLTSLSGEFALGSKPPSLTRIARIGLRTRLISRHKEKPKRSGNCWEPPNKIWIEQKQRGWNNSWDFCRFWIKQKTKKCKYSEGTPVLYSALKDKYLFFHGLESLIGYTISHETECLFRQETFKRV